MSVFDDLILQGRLFQTDGAAQEKDLWPSECVHTEGRQRMEVSEEARSWWVGLRLHVVCYCFKISFTVTLIVFYTFANYFVLPSLAVIVCFTCMCECVQVCVCGDRSCCLAFYGLHCLQSFYIKGLCFTNNSFCVCVCVRACVCVCACICLCVCVCVYGCMSSRLVMPTSEGFKQNDRLYALQIKIKKTIIPAELT